MRSFLLFFFHLSLISVFLWLIVCALLQEMASSMLAPASGSSHLHPSRSFLRSILNLKRDSLASLGDDMSLSELNIVHGVGGVLMCKARTTPT